jgi:hypothetical protein
VLTRTVLTLMAMPSYKPPSSSLPVTALGRNYDTAVDGLSYNTTAVCFTISCCLAYDADVSIHFPSIHGISDCLSNNTDSFFCVLPRRKGLRAGMGYYRLNDSPEIRVVLGHMVMASFNFTGYGKTWNATVTGYSNLSTSTSLWYPGEGG